MAFLKYEEELAKFEPSTDIGDLDKIIRDRNQKDAADILLEIYAREQEREQQERKAVPEEDPEALEALRMTGSRTPENGQPQDDPQTI